MLATALASRMPQGEKMVLDTGRSWLVLPDPAKPGLVHACHQTRLKSNTKRHQLKESKQAWDIKTTHLAVKQDMGTSTRRFVC